MQEMIGLVRRLITTSSSATSTSTTVSPIQNGRPTDPSFFSHHQRVAVHRRGPLLFPSHGRQMHVISGTRN